MYPNTENRYIICNAGLLDISTDLSPNSKIISNFSANAPFGCFSGKKPFQLYDASRFTLGSAEAQPKPEDTDKALTLRQAVLERGLPKYRIVSVFLQNTSSEQDFFEFFIKYTERQSRFTVYDLDFGFDVKGEIIEFADFIDDYSDYQNINGFDEDSIDGFDRFAALFEDELLKYESK